MKKTLFLLILINFTVETYSQVFHKIIPPITQSTEGINISKEEHYIVMKDYKLDKTILDKCELFCDSIQNSDHKKYFENTYIFYKKSKTLNENTNTSYINLVEKHKDDYLTILRYTRRKNKPVKKMFLLLNNGEVIKCYMDGVERKKRE